MNRALAALALAVTAAGAMAQPVQWRVQDGGNGHWYELVASPGVTWTAASGLANRAGGYLCTITSEAESDWIWSSLASNPTGWRTQSNFSGPHIGGMRNAAGSWTWVTGEPWVFTNTGPCFGGGGEDRLHFGCVRRENKWNDLNALDTNTGGLIVEWSADCNNDGLVDKGQILSGDLLDANNNGVPDGPRIAVQPADQSVGVDAPVTFIVEVAGSSCSPPVTYQWQRRNPAVADPSAPNAWLDLADGGGFFGTRAPNLSISRPIPALATGYRCKIGGGCGCEPNPGGFVYTNTVNFSVACPADFNADGGIDFGDIESFFERWEDGC